jgi:hypothetical protein
MRSSSTSRCFGGSSAIAARRRASSSAAFAIAQEIERQVHRDLVDPGAKRLAAAQPADALEGPHERALRDVLGLVAIAHVAVHDPQDASLVATDELVERTSLTGAKALDQGTVVVRLVQGFGQDGPHMDQTRACAGG